MIVVCLYFRLQLKNPLTDLPQILDWRTRENHGNVKIHDLARVNYEYPSQRWVLNLCCKYTYKYVYIVLIGDCIGY